MLLTRHKLLLVGLAWAALMVLALVGMIAYAALNVPQAALPPTVAALAFLPTPTVVLPPAASPARTLAPQALTSTASPSPAASTTPVAGTSPAEDTSLAADALAAASQQAAAGPSETLTEAAPVLPDTPTSTAASGGNPYPIEPSATEPPSGATAYPIAPSATSQPSATFTAVASQPPSATPTATNTAPTSTPTTTSTATVSPTPSNTAPPTATRTPPPPTNTAPPPTQPPAPGPVPIADFWGVNGGPVDGNNSASPFDGDLAYNAGLRAKSFFWMNQAGVRWFRNYGSDSIVYSWRFVEPSNGNYDWSAWDGLVKQAQGKDVALLASIGDGVPQWANGSADWRVKPTDLYTEPMTNSAWYQYVYHIVERYDGDGKNDMPGLTRPIKYWELWNEPDLREFWNGPSYPAHEFNGSVADYVRLTQVGYAAVKAADPSAQVVGPSTSQIIGNGTAGNNYLWTWGDWMKAGGLKYVDVVAFHAYFDRNGWDSSGLVDSVLNQLDANRGGKPVWVTEIGWDGGPTSDYQDEDNDFVRSVVLFWQRSPITRYFWYTLQETETYDGSHQKAFFQTLTGGASKGVEPDPLFHPIFRVSQVMARVLAGFGSGYHPGAVDVGGAARAFHFSRSGVDVWVAWDKAESGTTQIHLDTGGKTVRVISLYGDDLGTFSGGNLTVGSAPEYLTTQLNWNSSLGTITGRVRHSGQAGQWNDGAGGVTVTLAGPVNASTSTDADGNYVFAGLPNGAYTVSVAGASSQAVTVSSQGAWGRISFVVNP